MGSERAISAQKVGTNKLARISTGLGGQRHSSDNSGALGDTYCRELGYHTQDSARNAGFEIRGADGNELAQQRRARTTTIKTSRTSNGGVQQKCFILSGNYYAIGPIRRRWRHASSTIWRPPPVFHAMSTASKVTFGVSCAFALGLFVFINYSQEAERQALREGPIKDALRVNEKRNKKLARNELEHQEQIRLRQQYESVQPLSSEIIRAEEDLK